MIAGWLGSRPAHLRRYQRLYEEHDATIDVLTVIAPPTAVVEATYYTGREGDQMDQVGDYVWKQIQKRGRGLHVIFHLFSNGGCFLWERIRLKMDNEKQHSCQSFFSVVGVIFDSCPAWFGQEVSALVMALKLCTPDERREVQSRFGSWIFGGEDNNHRLQRKKRNLEFFENLEVDTLDVPQLHFYSRNDRLADCDRIQSVIRARRQRGRHAIIIEKHWEASIHCAHILQHGEEYREQLQSFIGLAVRRSRL